jgi:pseudaminic acid biosynthesis-associated methylase
MVEFSTEQERFWAGSFGNEYVRRNADPKLVGVKSAMFARMLGRAGTIDSALELGANIGLNMQALHTLLPAASLSAVEINPAAIELLSQLSYVDAHHTSLLTFRNDRRFDLTFTVGVLIHIAPERLADAYRTLYEHSKKYILVAEYYNTTPVEVTYRGHDGRLFKRDFAGEMLDAYPSLELRDHGFFYHREPNFGDDDTTWFLMEKRDSG